MEHEITDGRLRAVIKAAGAELTSLTDAERTEYIWQAGPAWPRHAPVLFPIVGRLNDDLLNHGGKSYRMTQHGFARDRAFSWIERGADSCSLQLVDDEETRAKYPFPFRLELSYRLAAGVLHVGFAVVNTGAETLPASFGAHPAFNWPLRPDIAQEDYALIFSQEEPAPIRRLAGGLMTPDEFATPIEGKRLALRENLFEADAIILDRVASRSVRFAAPQGPGVEVEWDGFRELGIWMKPGARFLCVEPWLGAASPIGFEGPFETKPGLALIAPGETRSAEMRIRAI
ncbi:Aldose 1-epimerase [Methylocella silvestris BL2]|uniref:Aldose 1-epimerase n=1 Tax=Methylocella silvestris (strain DSM 15510 / CIP 108128 / LMG 27833 / NCIMB 13906 / BL2) TaxID=395965 RepID=B8ELS6_METSB|nr:aldose 1-epimerase family protein [Methylocella silvestris]ACK50707.1 Aldose 1-epimerase [Methylocella silvestris BL2]